MSPLFTKRSLFLLLLLSAGIAETRAQSGDVKADVRIDASRITVGDAARVFIAVQHNPATSTVQWPALPDSLAKLEIVGKSPVDTFKSGGLVTYKQTLSITGFDSGMFTVPSIPFTIVPKGGTPYVVQTDSLQLLVQTVAVDTTKAFKPIKGLIEVQYTWRDYIWIIVGVLLFLVLAAVVIIYFIRNKRNKIPVQEDVRHESLQEKAQKLLAALDAEQLWQKGQVKEYYVRLTDVVRGYVEARYNTSALELTTDELIDKARITPGLLSIATPLETILRTADLAKFAKAQPTPQEHIEAMQLAKDLITATPSPIIIQPSPTSPA